MMIFNCHCIWNTKCTCNLLVKSTAPYYITFLAVLFFQNAFTLSDTCILKYEAHKISFQTFFVWALLLIVLASSDGISSWTPLKLQYSNPNPNSLANQLWCIDFLTPPTLLIIPHRLPAFLESLMPLKDWCPIHAKWLKSSLKHSIRFCGIIFSKLKNRILLHIVLLKCPHV